MMRACTSPVLSSIARPVAARSAAAAPACIRLPTALRAATAAAPARGQRLATVAMAGKQLISTDEAPAAVGAYSQAVLAGQTLYVSGQVGLVPGTKDLAEGGAEGQAEQALKNMGAILRAAGVDYKDVVKTTVLLADIADFAAVNAIYAKYFSEEPPARACYAAKALPLGAAVEIEAIAHVACEIPTSGTSKLP